MLYDIDLCYVVLYPVPNVGVLHTQVRTVFVNSLFLLSTQSFDTVLVLHVVYTHT